MTTNISPAAARTVSD